MNKEFNDEKLDQILEQIVKDSILSKAAIDEIADSPKLWWDIQRNIIVEKTGHKKSFFAIWQISAFASLVLILGFGLIWFLNVGNSDVQITAANEPIVETPEIIQDQFNRPPVKEVDPKTKLINNTSPAKIVLPRKRPNLLYSTGIQKGEIRSKTSPLVLSKKEEIKTEFIALAYSQTTESGQILKVKVPRSMMISLGVAANITNSSQLVSAEVWMGDDGLARAIRFVQ